jgi:fructokinase
MKIDSRTSVICFGEILWDVFPDEKKPGGAPFNVAVHMKQFGLKPKMISKIGTDDLGQLLLDFIKSKGLATDFIQRDTVHPTGVVNVKVGNSGDAKYDIVFPSAWDFIEYPDEFPDKEYILIFGSLASRNTISRNTLFRLLDRSKLALFDVNFRTPHYTRELIEQLLQKSTIVKLNEDEIKIIGEWYGMKYESIQKICEYLVIEYNPEQIIVTLGGKGAMVYLNGKVFRHPGFEVDVVDTVGSGDSFLASYLAHYLYGKTIEESLEMACATGAYVATQNGAVPEYSISNIDRLIHSGK